MALGTDGLITVVGDFDALDGAPVSGKVTITPSVQLTRGAVTYPQLPTVLVLDADGKFSIKLPATDDPAVSPNGFTYKVDTAVTAFVNGRAVTEVNSTNVSLTIANANSQGIASLSALVPAPAVGTPTIFLMRAEADARYALKGDIPTLPANVVTTDNISTYLVPVDLTGYPTTQQATTIAASAATAAATAAVADKVTTAQATSIADTRATAAVSGVIAPIQSAVTEARKGVVDGAFGLSIGIQDAAANSLYATQNPMGEYDPVTNRTYMAKHSNNNRQLFVGYLDHNTGQQSPWYFVKTYNIANTEDNHGAPSLAIDQNARRIVIFDGVHNDQIRCSRSGANMDITTWTVTALAGNAFLGTYVSVAYEPTSKRLYASFRSGDTHSTNRVYPSHEFGNIIYSADAGATWTDLGAGAGMVNTKLVYPGDACSDYYVADLDCYNGRVYITFSIAHGAAHDGPRSNTYLYYLDPADNSLHAANGQAVNLMSGTAGFDACRVTTNTYNYPVKAAVNPAGDVVLVANQYDATANYCRTFAAKLPAGSSTWTVVDTGVYSNYVYNGVAVAWRAGRWEIFTIRNTTGDNVVATTAQRDPLGGSSNGGDLMLLSSNDGLTWAVASTWNADLFTAPISYVQAIRNASPALIGVAQPVTFGVVENIDGDKGTGDIVSYNASSWTAEVYFIFATTNLPAVLNRTRRPQEFYDHNPIYQITGTSGSPAVVPPTSYTKISISPVPLPRGTTRVKLKVTCLPTGGTGRIILNFRAGGSARSSDDQVTFHASLVYGQLASVEVPVGPDGSIEWSATLDSGVSCTVDLRIRGHKSGAYRVASQTSKVLTPAATTTVAIPAGAAPDTTAPTAPSTVTATAGDASASVAFSGASDNVAVTGYRVYTAASGGSSVATGTTSPISISGLTNGSAVTFYVSALDAAGNESTRTASNSVTPAAASVAPTGAPTATLGTATVTTQPLTFTSVSGATAYDVEHKASSGSTWTVDSTAVTGTSYTVTGLTAATAYDYRVRARNSVGPGPYSATVSATTAASGGSPTVTTDGYDGAALATLASGASGQTYPAANAVLVLDGASAARLTGTTTTAVNYLALLNTTSARQHVEVDVTVLGTTTTPSHPAVIFGGNSAVNDTAVSTFNGYRASWDPTNLVWTLYKITSGATVAATTTPTNGIALSAAGSTTAPTAPYTLVAEVDGQNITIKNGATTVITATDTTPVGGTYAGWMMRGGNSNGTSKTQMEAQRVGRLAFNALA